MPGVPGMQVGPDRAGHEARPQPCPKALTASIRSPSERCMGSVWDQGGGHE